MITLGILVARTFTFNHDTRELLLSLIVNIAMPSIILSSVFNADLNNISFKLIVIVFVFSITINILGIGIGWVSSKFLSFTKGKAEEIALLSGLGNTGFIGIPLCAVLLGPEAALFAAIFDAGVDLVLWTLGVMILQEDKEFTLQSFKKMISIPTVAIIAGLFITYTGYNPPLLIVDLMDQLAGLAVPLAMLYIGFIISNVEFSGVSHSILIMWLPILIKLILLPLLVLVFVYFIPLNTYIINVILIQAMMPSLTLASVLFSKYACDSDFGAITTASATLVSLITIPSFIYLINAFI